MRIESCFRTTPPEVDSGRFNPYLGISISKKAFTKEYVGAFVDWALPRSREKVALLVVDVLQRFNNAVLGRYKPVGALEKAFRRADEVRGLCEEVLSSLSPADRRRVVLLEWPDIVEERHFVHNARVFAEAYETVPEMREALTGITRENLGPIVERLDEEGIRTLTLYILHELPEATAGFLHDGVHFDLNVYPGRISSVYETLLGLHCWAAIAARLRPIGPFASVELYE